MTMIRKLGFVMRWKAWTRRTPSSEEGEFLLMSDALSNGGILDGRSPSGEFRFVMAHNLSSRARYPRPVASYLSEYFWQILFECNPKRVEKKYIGDRLLLLTLACFNCGAIVKLLRPWRGIEFGFRHVDRS